MIFGIFSLLLAIENLLKHFIYFVEKMAVQVFLKIVRISEPLVLGLNCF